MASLSCLESLISMRTGHSQSALFIIIMHYVTHCEQREGLERRPPVGRPSFSGQPIRAPRRASWRASCDGVSRFAYLLH